jgi:hypothetical protein
VRQHARAQVLAERGTFHLRIKLSALTLGLLSHYSVISAELYNLKNTPNVIWRKKYGKGEEKEECERKRRIYKDKGEVEVKRVK